MKCFKNNKMGFFSQRSEKRGGLYMTRIMSLLGRVKTDSFLLSTLAKDGKKKVWRSPDLPTHYVVETYVHMV